MHKYWCWTDQPWPGTDGKPRGGRACGMWVWARNESDAACLFANEVWPRMSGRPDAVEVFVSTAEPPAISTAPVLRFPVTATLRPQFAAGDPVIIATGGLQQGVREWLREMTGSADAQFDVPERAARFTEEALELVQAAGLTKEHVLALVEYVFDRPVSDDVDQELGGTLTCLLALSDAFRCDLLAAGNTELARMQANIARIREKQRAKPAAVVFTRANPTPADAPTTDPGRP